MLTVKRAQSSQEKKDAYYIRRVVFIEEQSVPESLEVDELEKSAIHFIGYLKDEPVAASRLRIVDNYGKLERICVLKPLRGQYYGQKIIRFMEDYLRSHGVESAKLNAQTHAEAFYKELNYKTVSDEFMDAGIPHITMVKQLTD